MKLVEKEQTKKRPEVKVGDSVRVHLRIKEGNKERIQIFEGIVIAEKGMGISRTMTVRKISYGVGVEKIIPLNSPIVSKIEVVKRTRVNRAKLYYIREKVGKQAMKVGDSEDVFMTDAAEAPVEVVTEETLVVETPVNEETKDEIVKEEVAPKTEKKSE